MNEPNTAATISAARVGDHVCVEEAVDPAHRGIVYRITKQNPVNWILTPINGNGVDLRCPPAYLRPATADEIETAHTQAGDRQPPLHPGRVVTVAGRRWRQPADTLWVVTKSHRDGAADIAEFGGNRGRRYTSVPRPYLTPLSEVQIAAMKAAASITTAP